MDIRVATLCDFAQIREGLLFVHSAGITRVYRESFPAPIGVMLALVLEMSPVEANVANKIRVRVEDADGFKLAEMVGEMQVKLGSGHDPGEMVNVPFVADFRNIKLPKPGRYQVAVYPEVEGASPVALGFRAAVRNKT
ncbi:MAG: hypothetical protein F4138_02210 [Acidimicrobiia bacterium]|nr:hypothetical protein [Acidimicrobiia bacterium]MYC58056.1 hypothetical protein [Acidimicrobiia bacterium]MYG93795.1 hypothetical protein [Acidimicrobiia bacterium]MYI30771.1 hypothetical protein [Acidimicrobiia bacterium]